MQPKADASIFAHLEASADLSAVQRAMSQAPIDPMRAARLQRLRRRNLNGHMIAAGVGIFAAAVIGVALYFVRHY